MFGAHTEFGIHVTSVFIFSALLENPTSSMHVEYKLLGTNVI